MIRDTVPRDRDSHPHSACYDDLRFISKDPELAAEAVEICNTKCTDLAARACRPILAEILKTATGRSTLEGTWDGKHYTENTTGRQAASTPPRALTAVELEGRVTHCHRGHELTEENAYTDARGKRNCRTCGREARRRYKERQKGDAA